MLSIDRVGVLWSKITNIPLTANIYGLQIWLPKVTPSQIEPSHREHFLWTSDMSTSNHPPTKNYTFSFICWIDV